MYRCHQLEDNILLLFSICMICMICTICMYVCMYVFEYSPLPPPLPPRPTNITYVRSSTILIAGPKKLSPKKIKVGSGATESSG